MSNQLSATDPVFSDIVTPAYQKAWSHVSAKFSYFSMSVDSLRLISKGGKWIVDGTVTTHTGANFSWRVAVFRTSSDGSFGTAFRFLRRF